VSDPTKCLNCGHELVAGAAFCSSCGTAVARDAAPAQAPWWSAKPERNPTPVEPHPLASSQDTAEAPVPSSSVSQPAWWNSKPRGEEKLTKRVHPATTPIVTSVLASPVSMFRSRRLWLGAFGAFVVVFAAAASLYIVMTGGGDATSPVSGGATVRGTISLPGAGDHLTVESGLNSQEIGSGGQFNLNVPTGSTQSITVRNGSDVLGLAIIPKPSPSGTVKVDAQSTAAGLIFLAPGVANGTPDGDAQVLQKIEGLHETQALSQVISDGLSRNPSYLTNLATTPDQSFSNAYQAAVSSYLSAAVDQASTFAANAAVSAIPYEATTAIEPSGVALSSDGKITITPDQASGVSISVDGSQPSSFKAKNTRRRYVDVYEGDTRVAQLDAPGWMNLYQPQTAMFTLNPSSASSVDVDAFGPGIHGVPSYGTPQFSKLMEPTLGSVIFLTFLPTLDAILGVADIGKLELFKPLIEELLGDSSAVTEIANDYAHGDALGLTVDITGFVLDALESDFKTDPANSILVQYAGPAIASSLVSNWLVWLHIGMAALTGVDAASSFGAYATSNAHDTFTVTFQENVTPSSTPSPSPTLSPAPSPTPVSQGQSDEDQIKDTLNQFAAYIDHENWDGMCSLFSTEISSGASCADVKKAIQGAALQAGTSDVHASINGFSSVLVNGTNGIATYNFCIALGGQRNCRNETAHMIKESGVWKVGLTE
jgi:hypothetical protein